MERNLTKSAPVFAREGNYPSLYPWCTSQLDSTTDALILIISACDTGENPLVQAMKGTYYTMSAAETTSDVLAAHYGSGVPVEGSEPYYQYWHGYQLLIRPLLSIMDYSGIRLLNGITQAALLLILCVLFHKAGLRQYILPYLICTAMLMPEALVKSLQFSSCYYLLTLGTIAILRKRNSLDRDAAFLFLYLGIATAYFDFLTYPIATLGIPAIVYFCVQKADSIRDLFCRGVKICFSWCFGYIIMWAGKWFMGSLITGTNILSLASSKLAERSSISTAADDSLLKDMYTSLSVNVKSFIWTPVTLILAICLLVLFVRAAINWKKHTCPLSHVISVFFPFLILALLPVVWYIGTANHSTIHHWFTNKALFVSVFAAAASLVKFRESTVDP